MAEYIDRNAVMKEIQKIFHETDVNGEEQVGVMKCHRIIRTQPAVEVAPVVHGEWEKDPDMVRMDGHIYDYRCSHCHSMAEEGCYGNKDMFTNYCPNCGAKMDGERKEV